MSEREPNKAKKRAAKKATKAKKQPSMPDHKKAFEQLLDDAVLGIKNKK